MLKCCSTKHQSCTFPPRFCWLMLLDEDKLPPLPTQTEARFFSVSFLFSISVHQYILKIKHSSSLLLSWRAVSCVSRPPSWLQADPALQRDPAVVGGADGDRPAAHLLPAGKPPVALPVKRKPRRSTYSFSRQQQILDSESRERSTDEMKFSRPDEIFIISGGQVSRTCFFLFFCRASQGPNDVMHSSDRCMWNYSLWTEEDGENTMKKSFNFLWTQPRIKFRAPPLSWG